MKHIELKGQLREATGKKAIKALRKEGKLENLDQSEEINACTIKVKIDTIDGEEDWLLLDSAPIVVEGEGVRIRVAAARAQVRQQHLGLYVARVFFARAVDVGYQYVVNAVKALYKVLE